MMGISLILDEHEFDALDMLAARENRSLTFEQLYTNVWNAGDYSDSRDVARIKLEKLVDQVGEAGQGFMWIEYSPESGYTFRTWWAHNWKTQKNL